MSKYDHVIISWNMFQFVESEDMTYNISFIYYEMPRSLYYLNSFVPQ